MKSRHFGRGQSGCFLAGLFLALAWLAPFGLPAQTAASDPGVSGNRYLLIFDVSRGMRHRVEVTVKVVHDLLTSGMQGQLQPGDTVGVWTLADEVRTGQLPLQHWSPEAEPAVTSTILAFLRRQTYEKQANFDKLLPLLNRLVKDSEGITVILLSDGATLMRGTPFDEQINRLYALWRTEQQRTQRPFLTIWRAERGHFTAGSVTPAPWPVELPAVSPRPARPAPAVAQNPAPPAPLPPAPAPPKRTQLLAPPLILSGKQSGSAVPSQPALASPPPVAPARPAEPPPAQPSPAPVPAPAPATVVAEGSPTPRATSSPEAGQIAPAPNLPASVEGSIPGRVQPVGPSAEPKPLPAEASAPQQRAGPEIAAVVARTEPPPAKPAIEAAGLGAPVSTSGAPRETTMPADAPAVQAVATHSTAPAESRAGQGSDTAVAVETAVNAPAAAGVVSSAPLMGRKSPWLLVVLSLAGVGLSLVMLRRSRPEPRGSLITRSLERIRK